MPPHCDALDGPVATAALQALTAADPDFVSPYVPVEAEAELHSIFERVCKARTQGPEAMEVADRYFLETAVRLHRTGEGAPFTGLRPAGLDPGPAVQAAEEAVERGSPEGLVRLLADTVAEEAEHKFRRLWEQESGAEAGVAGARDYVRARLGLISWAHRVHQCARSSAREG